MFEKLLESVRGVTDGTRALADVEAISRFHRIQATAGYDEATDWLVDALTAAGYSPERIEVPADGHRRARGFPLPEGWRCRHAEAHLHGASGREPLADFARAPLSIVQRSGSARGRWPIVRLDSLADLARVEVRDRVVLTAGPVQRVHVRAVLEAGAAGLVTDGRRLMPPVRTEAHDRDALTYTSFWWAEDQPRGWGVVVSPARGAGLRERLAAGETLEIEVDFDCERFATTIPLVTTTLPGDLPGEVLVTGHLCHPMPGANDNASGAAAVLETARVLRTLADRGALASLRRTVRFLWMPEFSGTYAWHAHAGNSATETIAAVNLDMVGERQDVCGSTFLLERAPHFLGSFADELLARVRHAAQDWVRDFSGEGHYSLVRMAEVPYSGGSDHALWLDPAIGVPCPMLIQWPDRYYHTDLDTPDRVDPASLAHAVRSAATYAGVLACAGVGELRALSQMVERGTRRGLLAALDRSALREAAEAERERGHRALASLARLTHGLPGSHALVREWRTLLPLAIEALEGFWEGEIEPALRSQPPLEPTADGAVPVRRLDALLSPIRALLPGWDRLPASERDAWLDLEARIPGGGTALDLAWFACDGERTVPAIARLLQREGHAVTPADLEAWFHTLAALDLVRWRSPSAGSED